MAHFVFATIRKIFFETQVCVQSVNAEKVRISGCYQQLWNDTTNEILFLQTKKSDNYDYD